MHTRRNLMISSISAGLVAASSTRTMAAPSVFTKDGFALGGYDSAAYWTAKKATMGQVPFSFEWGGVNWLFANQSNRDTFSASPGKYAPAFNGYCPFCLAGGKLVPGVGNFWDIDKTKLYLLISERVKDEFMMKANYYVERATAYWAKLS